MDMSDETIEATLNERGNRYGDFRTQAMLTQVFMNTFNQHYYGVHRDGKPLDPVIAEGVHMVFHKLARIANGDPLYIDTVRDISGYMKLVQDYLMTVNGATDAQVTIVTKTEEGWV
jgi:hypothetical protein